MVTITSLGIGAINRRLTRLSADSYQRWLGGNVTNTIFHITIEVLLAIRFDHQVSNSHAFLMKIIRIIFFFLIAVVIPINSIGQSAPDGITESIILANVPDSSDFVKFLIRDLGSYFGYRDGKHFSISYEMLRDGPTQAGSSYPKFYLWVKLSKNNKIVNEGAVRVAAIEKQRFEVTHYLSEEDIKANPESIYIIFPAPAWGRIRAKIKQK